MNAEKCNKLLLKFMKFLQKLTQNQLKLFFRCFKLHTSFVFIFSDPKKNIGYGTTQFVIIKAGCISLAHIIIVDLVFWLFFRTTVRKRTEEGKHIQKCNQVYYSICLIGTFQCCDVNASTGISSTINHYNLWDKPQGGVVWP